ncbi:MAG: hypothetical protein C4294_18525 [Nitrospiraceae bacterium]
MNLKDILKRWKPISVFMRVDKLKQESLDWTNEVTQRGGVYSSSIVPKDLRNTKGRSILTRSGKLVAGVTLFRDWNKGEDAGINPLIMAMIFGAMISYNVFHTIFSSNDPTSFIQIGFTAFIFLVAYLLTMSPTFFDILIIGAMFAATFGAMTLGAHTLLGSILSYAAPAMFIFGSNKLRDNRRAKLLRFQASEHMDTMGEAHIENNETGNPLVVQINKALKDRTAFIQLGTATGTFQKNGDMNAPEPGTEFGLTIDDLSRGALILGKSGTGKSFTLRHILKGVVDGFQVQGKKIGMFITCGKGELAHEVAPFLDVIINPETVKNLNIIENLSPENYTKIIADENGANKVTGDNKIFVDSAFEGTYYGSVVHELLKDIRDQIPGYKYNLTYRRLVSRKCFELGNIDSNGNLVSHPLIDALKAHPEFGTNIQINDAIDFITSNQNETVQKMLQGINKQMDSWISGIFQSKGLRAWADCETSDFDLNQVAYGLKVGVALSPEQYGKAGTIITQLLKAKMRNVFAKRSYSWREDDPKATSIINMSDEVQDLINDTDLDNILKDRSRGVINIFATQGLTNLDERLGSPERTNKLLLGMSTIGSFMTDDKRTTDFLQHLAGHVRFVTSTIDTGAAIDFKHTNQVFLRSPEFDSNHPEAAYMKRSGGQSIIHSANEVLGVKYTGGFGGKFVRKTHAEFNSFATYNADANNPIRPLLSDIDFKHLEVPQHAFFRVMRAGMPRADIIKVKGISAAELRK